MKPVDTNLLKQFANAFCFGRKGLSSDEIPEYFSRYEGGVPTAAGYDMSVTKSVLFVDTVKALSPENQRLALYDLCDSPPESKHEMPSKAERIKLLQALVEADGKSPLAVKLSKVTLQGVRSQWFTAASRLPDSPASAITAARTLVEGVCKTILTELGETPDSSGEVSRLVKQTRAALGIDAAQGASQNVHQILSGLGQIVDGLAGLSNKAGDRHGLAAGAKITDLSFAALAVHAAGTLSLFLIRVYRNTQRGPSQ